jgi:integrase
MPNYRRGSGSVYLRGKTYWVAYYTPDGKQVCESAKTKDKAEARRILKARQGQIAEGRYLGPSADKVTFEELAEGLFNDYKANGKRSLNMAELRVRKHLMPFFGGKTAHGISTADIQAYITERRIAEASNAEINRELAALRRAYNLALRAERIYRKPHIPTLKESAPRQVFFEHHEFLMLLAKLPEDLRPPVQFAYVTGWRLRSEVLPLTWEQVDLEAGTVRLFAGTTKNGEGRIIWLTDELKAMFSHLWETRPGDCPWVFHRNGRRIRCLKGAWEIACKAAGLRGKVPHDLRRSAVRNLVRAGIPERVAMQVTGHADRSVFERYNIVSPGDLQQVAAVLNVQNRKGLTDTVANNYKNDYTRSSSQSEHKLSS